MARSSAYQRIDSAGPDAPWLTLIHGATQNREVFSAQRSAFQDRYRLLLVDLPGHGEAAAHDGPFGVLEYADAVLGALDDAGVVSTHLWGTHTGTAIALVLGRRSPGRFKSFVLEGAVIPGRELQSVTTCYERARATLCELGLAAARQEWFEQSPWFDVIRARPVECRAAAHRALIEHFEGAPWRDSQMAQRVNLTTADLACIDIPTLLINGEHEVADFLPAALELTASMPCATPVRVPEAGGFPLWEFPHRVNALVEEHLQQVAAGPSAHID